MKGCLSPDRIFLYLEGQLEPGERRAFKEHLERCPACRAAYEERRLLHQAFTTLPAIELPPGFSGTVMAAIPEERRTVAAALSALAAGFLALSASLLGFYLLTGRSVPDLAVSVSRSLGAGLGGLLPLLAKVLKSAGLALELLYGLLSSLAGGLGALSSVVRPGIAGLALGLGLILTVLMLFGAKKLLSVGERS
jgi:predicted anti-sigma-YlaC factor YlaD